MAAAVGLTVVKRFPYRGDNNEEFSNQYWLSGSVPADAAAWRTLFDALVTQEKTVYRSVVEVVGGYGYDTDTPGASAIWSVDLTQSPNTPVAGTVSSTSGVSVPGDVACTVRWKTSRLTSPGGKPIYLRKYFHGVLKSNIDDDVPSTAQLAALNAFGLKMRDGSFAGARTLRSQTSAETLTGHGAGSYMTTRTLKRRGKRPGA